MKSLSFSITSIFLSLLFLAGCSSELPEIPATDEAIEPAEHILPMRLVGDINRFADGESTRGASTTTTSWNENDSLYVQFQTTQGVIDGVAIYRSGDWQVHYWGSQSPDASSSAKVYHLCNIANPTSSPIGLSAKSGVYADTLATYVYEEGVLTLTARLNPLTGRIRFRGTSGQSLTFSGLRWFSAYDTKGKLASTTGEVTLTVGSDGYTPYVYGTFEDANDRSLFVQQDADNLFQKRFVNGVLDAGRSGYVSIPTATSHSGWTMTKSYREFTVSGHGKTVSIKMRRVDPGTFQMGSTTGDSNEQPVHSVTISKAYYMCETEVTQALWYAVMGQSPTSDGDKWNSTYGLGDNYPAYEISYEDCRSFLSALNSKLSSQLGSGEQFRFPTEAEWEFAAKGGNKSKGYTYAGSNTIDDVAWYNNNSSSSTHQIKTKAANELGLYDMSGNVWEWCEDWYGSYSTGAQTDPTGAASGSLRVYRGGCWYYSVYSARDCRVSSRYRGAPNRRYYDLGLRLCLGAPVSESIASLSVSSTSLSYGADVSSQTITVITSGDYTYSTNASWLTITHSNDKSTLTVSASANTDTSDRTAIITLTLGSLTQTITVTQKGSDNERTFTVTGNGKTVTFKMIRVEGGTFQMGSTTGESDEQPVHSVTISKAYYMCETEVTQALWYAVMGLSPTSDGSQWNSTDGLGDNYPAYYISYEDCQSFLTALNSKLSSQLGSGEQFRFPTEAEWEFAAKGGTKSKGYTYAGSNTIGDVAWYSNNSNSSTHQIKIKAANELGLYDMSGNVWEWCEDWYGSYSTGAQTDPTGAASGSYRVNRGGSWGYNARGCRVSHRSSRAPAGRSSFLGLRLAQ